MKYLQVTIQCSDPSIQEMLIAQIADVGFEGFEQTDGELIAYIKADEYQPSLAHEILINTHYDIKEVLPQNWNKEWESNFEPVVIDQLCAIRAHFHEPIPNVRYEIVITPKMSFGTGHHATTRMMMVLLGELDLNGKYVLDFGTGTGVLAIFASMLGAAAVLAVDNDDWSIANATENVERNAAHQVSVQKDIQYFGRDAQYDVILANINRQVLLEHFAAMFESLKDSGTVLMSGILDTDKDIVNTGAEAAGFTVKYTIGLGNWVAVVLKKVATVKEGATAH